MPSLDMTIPVHATLFEAPHSLYFEIPHDKFVVVFTGIAIVDFKETLRGWRRDRLELTLLFPPIIPPGKKFVVEQRAPFVTLNAITSNSNSSGWAVDGFAVPNTDILGPDPTIRLTAELAVYETNSLLRVGYSLMVTGRLEDLPPNWFKAEPANAGTI